MCPRCCRCLPYNNTVYFNSTENKGVTCEKCATDVLTMKNNILVANEPFWSNAPFVESNNIFWSSTGAPLLHWYGFSMDATSKVVAPQFVDVAHDDFRLQTTSPAVNSALRDSVVKAYYYDLDKTPLPVASVVDIGPYEHK